MVGFGGLNDMKKFSKNDNQFSKTETEERLQAALRGARIAGHKELKDIPKKNGESRKSGGQNESDKHHGRNRSK